MGMSDDDDAEKESDDEEDTDTDRNVVASAVQQSSAGAFIVGPSLAPASLGLTEPDNAFDLGILAANRSRRPSISSCEGGASPLMSPLIAQLNPFTTPPLGVRRAPDLPWAEELPPAAFDQGAEPGDVGTSCVLGIAGAADSGIGAAMIDGLAKEDDSEAASAQTDAQMRLLVEMGDLVCKLQERRELSITSLAVSPEDLFSRLAHFRELAGSAELRCRC